MTGFLIPLQNTPQTFEIALAGKNYLMTCKWNDADEGGWVLDLKDVVTNLPIAANIPLISGADILEGLEYLGISGSMYIFTKGDDFAVPTLLNLGVESNLYFQTSVAG
jgi:hypothetical protein